MLIDFKYAEINHFAENDNPFSITIGSIVGANISDYMPATAIGKLVTTINSIYGYFLLGLIIWIVQASLSNHKPKSARFILF